jgi:Tol biopolymer transport system component
MLPTYTPEPVQSSSGPVLIVFANGPIGDSDIYSSDESGHTVFAEATASCDEAEPAVSPDGKTIAYQSDCDGNYDIWLEDFGNGSGSRRITTDSGHDEREPHWSPDGRQIAYRLSVAGQNRNSNGEIWIMDADGSDAYFLGIMGRSPTFSPDGRTIAYMSDESGKWQIHAFEIAGRRAWQVTSEDSNCRWPSWSPDSRYIVFNTTNSALTSNGIWYVPKDGGKATNVISGPGYGRPSWSSNGWIAFNSIEGIDLIQPNGSNHVVIIPEKLAWAPAFSN